MPRRFAPRNDSGEVSSRPMPSLPCTAATQQVSTHPTRPTALHPLTRRRLLHVIARSGAAAPRRGNPRPRRSTKREAVPKANSQPSTNLPKPQPTCPVFLRGCGLPRRFAPRNDSGEVSSRPMPSLPCTRCHAASFHAPNAPHGFANANASPPSACHCEPVRTLVWQSVFPAEIPGKVVLLLANS